MKTAPTHLDLFSGIGGFALAASWAGFETRAFCEIDPFCVKVIGKNFANVPVFGDISTVTADSVAACGIGRPDLATFGFPCQPFSVIGKRAGTDDDRYLWPETLRVVDELRPRWVVAENVAGVLDVADSICIPDLESLGYEVWAAVIPAVAVGAPHLRERVWIIAHTDEEPDFGRAEPQRADCPCGEARPEPVRRAVPPFAPGDWPCEPRIRRLDDGIPSQLDRLGAFGNAIVPQVAYEILRPVAAQLTEAIQ